MKNMKMPYYKEKGFTLVELSIVLLIVSLVLGSAASAYFSYYKNKAYETSSETLKNIKDNLISYASFNGHLPCPDVNGDGKEDRNGNSCAATIGDVPYSDLQMMHQAVKDGYGSPIKYAVTGSASSSDPCAAPDNGNSYFCDANNPAFSKDAQNGEVKVCPTDGVNNCNNGATAEAEGVIAVLIAQNKDGVQDCSTLPSKEKENCDGDNFFFTGSVETSDSNEYFDDQIDVITPLEVKNAAMKTGNIADAGSAANGAATAPSNLQIAKLDSSDPNVAVYNGSLNNDKSGKQFADQVKKSKTDQNVLIAGDANIKLDGSQHKDYIEIDGNLNDDFNGKNSADKLLVTGDANDSIKMEGGNDQVEIYGNVNHGKLDAGTGNDTVYIHGDINKDVKLGSGDDIARVDGNINKKLDGGSGNDTLYVNMSESEFNSSWQKKNVEGFENIIFLK